MRYIASITIATALAALIATPASADGVAGGFRGAFGPHYGSSSRLPSRPRSQPPGVDAVRRWNEIAIDASGLDHTPVAAGETRVFGEQLGPTRASRAMAIVHIAVFDAVNAVSGNYYQSYTGLRRAPDGTSLPAAVAQAAHDTLAALFPSQSPGFDDALAADLARIRNGAPKTSGVDVGRRAAAAILALRSGDGSEIAEPRMGTGFVPSNDAGKWRQDPLSLGPLALGAFWGDVTPFTIAAGDQFRVPPPPAMTSAEYAAAFAEAKALGGDVVHTPTVRTAEQTDIGTFWAYDGTPSLCAPPRLYNQIAVQIADQMQTTRSPMAFARLLALVNVAMADAGIAIWESKFFYQFWRPVIGIREADAGTGPLGLGDGNPATVGDPGFWPLGAPASNLTGPNFTPPFPSYPSGHAGFGGALFQTLRDFYRTDRIAFTFVSDELNGVTVDNQGNVRPRRPRRFATLSKAEEENGQSRIYLGIHWAFDKTAGIAQGRSVADYVFQNEFVPLRRTQ